MPLTIPTNQMIDGRTLHCPRCGHTATREPVSMGYRASCTNLDCTWSQSVRVDATGQHTLFGPG